MQTATGDRGGPLGIFAKWWRNWSARDAALGELGCCGREEVAHIARDVGVSVPSCGRWPADGPTRPICLSGGSTHCAGKIGIAG